MPKVPIDGVNLHYWQVGKGSDLVLLHGLTGNLAVWHFTLVPKLRNRYRMVTYDLRGHGRSDMPPTGYTTRHMAEVPVDADDESKPGDAVLADIFGADEKVHVIGRSKGRGFTGVIKRHNFSGGKATHGSMHHRGPGSIGQSAYPSRVFRGMKGPGQMGNRRITVKNLEVVQVDAEKNMLVIKGAVPGSPGTYLTIRRSQRPPKKSAPTESS